jgi:tetratricopeptide (TPR) repeat protein
MAELEPRLREHPGRCIVIGGCVSFFGSVDHYLGLIYAATGRRQEATEAFRKAIAAYDRLGAGGWVARTRRALEAMAGENGAPAAELRREGPVWAVRYGDGEIRVKDSKGMRDLAALLSAPGHEIAAAELMARGLSFQAGADPVLDAEARARFRRRLDELDEDLTEAERANDLGHIGRLRDERDALAHELAAAVGLGGRARTLGDPAERARKAVSARIRDAIQRVGAEHADLGHHLKGAVRTGTFCSYSPGAPTRWRVTDGTVRQS